MSVEDLIKIWGLWEPADHMKLGLQTGEKQRLGEVCNVFRTVAHSTKNSVRVWFVCLIARKGHIDNGKLRSVYLKEEFTCKILAYNYC